MNYANWRKRLAISQQHSTVAARREAVAALKINFSQPTEADCGYYRKPIGEKMPNGRFNVTGWIPVAYFLHAAGTTDEMLCGVIGTGDGMRDMTPEELTDEELWSYVVSNPIPYEWYQAVAENGEAWPDATPPLTQSESPTFTHTTVVDDGTGAGSTARVVEIGDNKPPVVEPHIEHGEAIDRAVGAAQDLKITDEASAAVALGAINRIAELRLAADKAGRAIYEPLHKAYTAEQKKWPPMIKKAKDAETALNMRYLKWREAEKQKAAEAAAEAARKQREIDEANERAAQRAIAQGQPEPPPEVLEEPPAAMPAPAPVAPTYRASGQRTAPKEVERWWLDGIDDYDKVYEAFKNDVNVRNALQIAAAAAVKNGQEVPGTRRHFGLI